MARKPSPGIPSADKPKETKNEKFQRIANAKTLKALNAISGVAAVATKAYEYSAEEAATVVKALEAEVVKVARKLNDNIAPKASVKSGDGFNLFAASAKGDAEQPKEGGDAEQPKPEPAKEGETANAY